LAYLKILKEPENLHLIVFLKALGFYQPWGLCTEILFSLQPQRPISSR